MNSRLPRMDKASARTILIRLMENDRKMQSQQIDEALQQNDWDSSTLFHRSGIAFLPVVERQISPIEVSQLRGLIISVCQAHGYPTSNGPIAHNASELDWSCGSVLRKWWKEVGLSAGEACHGEVWYFLNAACFADVISWRFPSDRGIDHGEIDDSGDDLVLQADKYERFLNWGKKRAWLANLWWMTWLAEDSDGHIDLACASILKVPQYRTDLLERSGRGYDRDTLQAMLRAFAAEPDLQSRNSFRTLCMNLIRVRSVYEPEMLGQKPRDGWVKHLLLGRPSTPRDGFDSFAVSDRLSEYVRAPVARVSLLGLGGEVQKVGGLNWGQRPDRNPNQAYLQLAPAIYNSNFFPKRPETFKVFADDEVQLTMVRAQKDEQGQVLLIPGNNAELGLYFRSRLGLPSGEKVLREHLENYGRTHVDFFKIGDSEYFMDFAPTRGKIKDE